MSTKMTGTVEAITPKTVDTKSGKSPKTDITIAGKIYSMWGSLKGIIVGDEVSLEYEPKGVFNNIIEGSVFKVQSNKLPIQQVSKSGSQPTIAPPITVSEPVERALLKEIIAKLAEFDERIGDISNRVKCLEKIESLRTTEEEKKLGY